MRKVLIRARQRVVTAINPHNANNRFIIPKRNALKITPALLYQNGERGSWYDFGDLSTLFQDVAGTAPVTAPGQLVARVNDKSPNGVNLIQATAGKRPTYTVNGGYGGINFISANQTFMQTASAIAWADDDISFVVGVSRAANTTWGRIFETGTSFGTQNGVVALDLPSADGATTATAYIKGTAIFNVVAAALAAPVRSVLGYVGNCTTVAGSLQIYKNATLAATNAPIAAAGTVFSTQNTYIGAATGGTGQFFNGMIYSFVSRSGPTTSDIIHKTSDYVNGLTGAY
jgi:hypothetical protein